ncbi:hypothetical protein M231_02282 [Tremella mesenterica]|uniref:Uncharacterized protein n=1 Tax=Tremella mesenterica TaxID=5217 RepID=A0A4Q1BR71_TREME|nr:uncharacterized protein TREMEDRAFT_65407 [Tremella mesenterica DSM 1558]EIW66537.1 hypothetical protein TREMEDRAFT_65407 [Tremella mesenterica DSM 1558]RXK40449.1 hypothetical protein M231_02282 [Tremella mesenterica]
MPAISLLSRSELSVEYPTYYRRWLETVSGLSNPNGWGHSADTDTHPINTANTANTTDDSNVPFAGPNPTTFILCGIFAVVLVALLFIGCAFFGRSKPEEESTTEANIGQGREIPLQTTSATQSTFSSDSEEDFNEKSSDRIQGMMSHGIVYPSEGKEKEKDKEEKDYCKANFDQSHPHYDLGDRHDHHYHQEEGSEKKTMDKKKESSSKEITSKLSTCKSITFKDSSSTENNFKLSTSKEITSRDSPWKEIKSILATSTEIKFDNCHFKETTSTSTSTSRLSTCKEITFKETTSKEITNLKDDTEKKIQLQSKNPFDEKNQIIIPKKPIGGKYYIPSKRHNFHDPGRDSIDELPFHYDDRPLSEILEEDEDDIKSIRSFNTVLAAAISNPMSKDFVISKQPSTPVVSFKSSTTIIGTTIEHPLQDSDIADHTSKQISEYTHKTFTPKRDEKMIGMIGNTPPLNFHHSTNKNRQMGKGLETPDSENDSGSYMKIMTRKMEQYEDGTFPPSPESMTG